MRERNPLFQQEGLKKEQFIGPELGKIYRERIARLMKGVREKNIDTLVFLDRSARPFSWLFKEMWKNAHPGESLPKMIFLNIGSENVIQTQERKFDYDVPFNAQKRDSITKEDKWLLLTTPSPHQKNVLVIDEMLVTGKSLLRAMRFIQSSDTYGNIYGTGLFSTIGRGQDEDKKTIPWLHEPGMVGVLELPHSLPFSGGITQKNIDCIQEHVTKCIEGEIENIKKTFTEIQKILEKCITVFVKNEIKVDVLQKGQKRLGTFLAKNPYQDPRKDHLYDNIRLSLLKEISSAKRFFTDYSVVCSLSQAESQLSVPYTTIVEKLRSLQKLKKEDYGDLKKLHDRHIALRKEIKRIAHEL